MRGNRTITLFFEYFTSEHFGKDPFLVPYYLGKKLGYSVTILYPLFDTNITIPSEVKGVKMVGLPLCGNENTNFRFRYRNFYKYLWENASSIDIMIRFFDGTISREWSILYKMRNPNGKFYIKMDIDPMTIDKDKTNHRIFRGVMYIKNRLLDWLSKKCVDVISCETSLAYNKLISSKSYWHHWGNKLVMMPNGFDEEFLQELGIAEKSFDEKDNMMITVGRLGTPPKNTPMLLDALSKVDLKNWRFLFVGPIEDSLRPQIESFYKQCPEKQGNVLFLGSITDKKQLWNIYNNSKVFVLTSLHESFGLVLVEALRFKNYLVTTPVGASFDVVGGGKFGVIVENNNIKDLVDKLQNIIDNGYTERYLSEFDPKILSWSKCLDRIIQKLES